MMRERWRSTRSRLRQDTVSPDATGIWQRIDQSRSSGRSVTVPAADPRRRPAPALLGVFAFAALAGFLVLRQRERPTPMMTFTNESDDAAFGWFATPAYAQGNGASDLPPIDSPDLSRLVPARLVYRYASGADGFITQQDGTDTTWVGRDTVGDLPRLLLRRIGGARNPYSSMRSNDSVALGADGRLLFWHWHVVNLRTVSATTIVTSLLVDSIQTVNVRPNGEVRFRASTPASYEYYLHQPLIPLFPALPVQPGYARSISVLDLLGGETTSGFRRSVELRVTGKAWVNVPMGRFHCWVLDYSVVPDPGEKRYTSKLYLDIESGALVRAEWRTGKSFFTEQVLLDRQLLN